MKGTLFTRSIREGCRRYHRVWPEDRVYLDATRLIRKGQRIKGCVLLLSKWNRAAMITESDYRTWLTRCLPDFDKMGQQGEIDDSIFEKVLRVPRRSGRTTRQPVGVVKVLHMLFPSVFPPWDNAIALRYHLHHSKHQGKMSGSCYVRYREQIMQELRLLNSSTNFADAVRNCPTCAELKLQGDHAAFKLIDELNFSEWTYPPVGPLSGRSWYG